jgi:hypothetical protein
VPSLWAAADAVAAVAEDVAAGTGTAVAAGNEPGAVILACVIGVGVGTLSLLDYLRLLCIRLRPAVAAKLLVLYSVVVHVSVCFPLPRACAGQRNF